MDFQKFKPAFRNALKFLPEWIIIAVWALWIGRPYLDMGSNMWPSGGQEYIMSMQNQYMWTLLPVCGSCFFWNGFTNGGVPSFIDLHSGWLHPISIISTFLFGVFNSGKVISIASIFMAGMGQWWFGRVLRLGTISRMWTALVVVASGSLVGRLQMASPPLVLSTAACFLVFPAVLELILRGGRKAVIILGITLGLAALSGQGYLQIGLMIGLIPMILVLLMGFKPDGPLRINSGWRPFLFAIILAGLIAAPLLVPLLHLAPLLVKHADPFFGSMQPLEYNPLNLVINDPEFYHTTALGKLPYPYLYVNYVGWVPVILAIFGLFLASLEYRKIVIAIGTAIGFIYLASSGLIFKWISLIPNTAFIASVQNPALMQGLAGLLILALAGMGVEELIKKEWPQIGLTLSKANQSTGALKVNIYWIILFLPMIFALYSVADFSKYWIYVAKDEVDRNSLLKPLKTTDAQWVQPPYGEYFWLPAAVENGMKIRDYFRPWYLEGAELPRAYLEMSPVQEDANLPEYFATEGQYIILKRPDNLYASISDGNSINACQANATGGFIQVTCDTNADGRLSVLENAISGWTATRDGQKISLLPEPWLTVSAPAGKHNYTFRYQPWDAVAGIVLSVVGWLGAIAGLFYFSKKDNSLHSDFSA